MRFYEAVCGGECELDCNKKKNKFLSSYYMDELVEFDNLFFFRGVRDSLVRLSIALSAFGHNRGM